MTEATNRCKAFERAARQEAALQAVQDGTDASDAGYIERFVRVATLQERHRAAQTLSGAAALAGASFPSRGTIPTIAQLEPRARTPAVRSEVNNFE